MDYSSDQDSLMMMTSAASKDRTMMTMSIKGKRTKRLRPNSPSLPPTTASSSGCSLDGGSVVLDGGSVVLDGGDRAAPFPAPPSPSHSAGGCSGADEEEDMANCLILLARGHRTPKMSPSEPIAPSAADRSRVSAYQCKTCERCFPSFQALGGHRANHKKPKTAAPAPEEKKPPPTATTTEKEEAIRSVNNEASEAAACTALSLRVTGNAAATTAINRSNKVHECSICGAEFSSGQALGGHMRRHRPIPTPAAASGRDALAGESSSSQQDEAMKQRSRLLSLDLNLPAPEDKENHHHSESKFPFSSKQQVIVFSASPLVDCHY